MRKFEIMTDNFEFRFGTRRCSVPIATSDQIWQWYNSESVQTPEIRVSFDTLDAAQEEFNRNWLDFGCTSLEKGQISWLLVGKIAWIEESIYDEFGEFVQSGDRYDISAQGYQPENDDD